MSKGLALSSLVVAKQCTELLRSRKENEMKKAVTIYMDDDSEVEGVAVVLCTVKDDTHHATGMFNSSMKGGHDAIYFPHDGKIIEFREDDQ